MCSFVDTYCYFLQERWSNIVVSYDVVVCSELPTSQAAVSDVGFVAQNIACNNMLHAFSTQLSRCNMLHGLVYAGIATAHNTAQHGVYAMSIA